MVAGDAVSAAPGDAYDDAVRIMFGEQRSYDLYTHWKEIRAALDHIGVRYGELRKHRSWEKIDALAIVACIGRKKDRQLFHWVVYDGAAGLLYDPLRTEPYRPDGRTRRPKSYLPIRLPKKC